LNVVSGGVRRKHNRSVWVSGVGEKRTLPEEHDITERLNITIQQRKCTCNSLWAFLEVRTGCRPYWRRGRT